jgi:PadR family transcriptional regulator PadR
MSQPFDRRESARDGTIGLPPRGTPKNYLTAWLLVILKGRDLHGYEIIKILRDRFHVECDAGTVYRVLRQLEADGCIVSRWLEQEHASAKRVYTLAEGGVQLLSTWHSALTHYRTTLDAFFMLSGET